MKLRNGETSFNASSQTLGAMIREVDATMKCRRNKTGNNRAKNSFPKKVSRACLSGKHFAQCKDGYCYCECHFSEGHLPK